MDGVTIDKKFVLAFRLLMGWTFLYAGHGKFCRPISLPRPSWRTPRPSMISMHR